MFGDDQADKVQRCAIAALLSFDLGFEFGQIRGDNAIALLQPSIRKEAIAL